MFAKRICIALLMAGGLVIGLSAETVLGNDMPVGSFFVELGGGPAAWNVLNKDASGGDGWNDNNEGPWFSYPQPEPWTDPAGNVEDNPTWWNQWWYNHPFDPNRWKIIDMALTYELVNPDLPGYMVIVVNWSTPEWSTSGTADAPPLEDGPGAAPWIGRIILDELILTAGSTAPTPWEFAGFPNQPGDPYRLPVPYNPEWISVDVRGYNIRIIEGKLWHDCVPEPQTLAFLAFGAMGLLRRRGK